MTIKRKKINVSDDLIVFESFQFDDNEKLVWIQGADKIELRITDDDAIKIIEFLVLEFDMKVTKEIEVK